MNSKKSELFSKWKEESSNRISYKHRHEYPLNLYPKEAPKIRMGSSVQIWEHIFPMTGNRNTTRYLKWTNIPNSGWFIKTHAKVTCNTDGHTWVGWYMLQVLDVFSFERTAKGEWTTNRPSSISLDFETWRQKRKWYTQPRSISYFESHYVNNMFEINKHPLSKIRRQWKFYGQRMVIQTQTSFSDGIINKDNAGDAAGTDAAPPLSLIWQDPSRIFWSPICSYGFL